jgi:hypothetical protein
MVAARAGELGKGSAKHQKRMTARDAGGRCINLLDVRRDIQGESRADLSNDSRVAVLVDCDNTSPEILEYALQMVAQFGRVVMRRGYGNHITLANKWQEALVGMAFTLCLQYQYAAGKNTPTSLWPLMRKKPCLTRKGQTSYSKPSALRKW